MTGAEGNGARGKGRGAGLLEAGAHPGLQVQVGGERVEGGGGGEQGS